MNKLGRKEYIKLIADSLTNEYGRELREFDTDIDLAKAVLNKLRPYLFFHSMDMSKKEWDEWKKQRTEQ